MNNISIILTSTVNINPLKHYIYQKNMNDRAKTYCNIVKKWLNNTNLNIILVENSGYNFPELSKEKEKYKNRFEIIVFKEIEEKEAEYLKNNTSKGASEMFSINYAFLNSKIIHKSNFIIKITGRYYISSFEKYLNKFNLDNYSCLTQNNRNRCEIVGCHYKYFSYIFYKYLINSKKEYDNHVENIWKERTSKLKNIFVCRHLKIQPTKQGGINNIYEYL
jgi:hypothetical protein